MAPRRSSEEVPLSAAIDRLDDGAVRELLLHAAESHPDLARAVRLAAAGPDDRLATLRAAVDETLRTRRYLDWRDSSSWGFACQPVVEALELEAATAPSRELLAVVERAVGHVVKVIHHADDSSGVIGGVARDLLDVHLNICRAGVADQLALAKWLLKFSLDDQDFFNPDPVQYAAALGDKGMAHLRKVVAERMAAPQPPFAAQHLQQRLAVADGDIPRVIELLGGDLRNTYQFIRVAEALSEMGRADDALAWAQRGIAETTGWQVGKLYDLAVGVLAGRGDADAVLRMRREQHGRMASSSTYSHLRAVATECGVWADDRPGAIAALAARDPGGLIDALLAEGVPDEAWAVAAAADGWDPGSQRWALLAELREPTHPADALRAYLRLAEDALGTADKNAYRIAVKHLKAAKRAAAAAGLDEEFAIYVVDLAERNRRRPTLMDLLRKAGFVR